MSFPPSGPPGPGAPNQPQPPYGGQNQPYQPYGQPAQQPQPYGDPYAQPGQQPAWQGAPAGQAPFQGGPGTPPPFPGAQPGNPFAAPPGSTPPPSRGGKVLRKIVGSVGGLVVIGVVAAVNFLPDFLDSAERDDVNNEIVQEGTLRPWDLKVGDCFNDDQNAPPPADGTATSQTVNQIKALPCANPHNAQVITSISMSGAFPGDQAIVDRCEQKALKWMDGHPSAVKKLEKQDPNFGVLAYFPLTLDWSTDGNRVTCSIRTSTPISFKLPT
ncbi:hypothetical protein [Actinocorallia sp. A-T 12471]|uniref:hypothetical protein n=1 Tax=Actinocorallia sp. A-T 12471 TaxID=3089813 RepID=UPI0029CB7151|nr:hypothetical protein [Actinocorallia sp. A-T 12471]MDX6744667.1 hypothetical protein [Actinocorallia sp. A-T 12471]